MAIIKKNKKIIVPIGIIIAIILVAAAWILGGMGFALQGLKRYALGLALVGVPGFFLAKIISKKKTKVARG